MTCQDHHLRTLPGVKSMMIGPVWLEIPEVSKLCKEFIYKVYLEGALDCTLLCKCKRNKDS